MPTGRWVGCGVALLLIAFVATFARAAAGSGPLTLSESIALALARSPLVQAARERVRTAEAERGEAFTGFLPKFTTSYSYTRLHETPAVTSPGLSFTLPGPPPVAVTVPRTTQQAGTKDNHHWNVELRQPLFAGGGIRASHEASRIGERIARVDAAAAMQDLVLEVKLAYYNVLKSGRIEAVARQSLERLAAHRAIAQGFFDVGLIAKNDLLAAEVELANGRQFLLRSENAREIANARFNSLLGREIATPVSIADTLDERPPVKPLDRCIAEALERRPELRSQAHRIEQARSLLLAAESDYYPNVALVGNYSRYGDTPALGGTPFRDQESWYLMGVATWNFWEWGRTGHRVAAVRGRANQAASLLQHARDQVVLEVKQAWLLLVEAETQIGTARTAIAAADENFRINSERYREQVGTATDVIDAQTLLTRARADHDNALGDYGIARARLERAIGVDAPSAVP